MDDMEELTFMVKDLTTEQRVRLAKFLLLLRDSPALASVAHRAIEETLAQLALDQAAPSEVQG